MCTTVEIITYLALVIVLLGLFGFTGDEVARRTKEIAVRKVNGASVLSITLLLLRNICFGSHLTAFKQQVIIVAGVWLFQREDDKRLLGDIEGGNLEIPENAPGSNGKAAISMLMTVYSACWKSRLSKGTRPTCQRLPAKCG